MKTDVLDFGDRLETKKSMFSAAELALFWDLLHELDKHYGQRIQAVKLVGSRARGTARHDSDYDFLVFLDECDYAIEVPRLKGVGAKLEHKHQLAPLSLSPLSREQFLNLDTKYEGIIQRFRNDAIALA